MLVNVLNGVQTYFITADRNPARITKTDKDFSKNFDFKDIKSPVKVRDMHEIEKKNSISISVFGYENMGKHPLYISEKCCEEQHVDFIIKTIKKQKTLCSIIHLCIIIL